NICDLKKEPNPARMWPTVEDFYKANTVRKPVVLVADPNSAIQDGELTKFWNERNGVIPRPVAPVAETVQPVPNNPYKKPCQPQETAEPKVKKVRGEKIIIGNVYGTWTVDSDTGHSRFACTCTTCGKKKTIFSGYLRDSSAPCEHK